MMSVHQDTSMRYIECIFNANAATYLLTLLDFQSLGKHHHTNPSEISVVKHTCECVINRVCLSGCVRKSSYAARSCVRGTTVCVCVMHTRGKKNSERGAEARQYLIPWRQKTAFACGPSVDALLNRCGVARGPVCTEFQANARHPCFIHTHTHTHTHSRTHTHAHTHTHTHTRTHTHTHTNVIQIDYAQRERHRICTQIQIHMHAYTKTHVDRRTCMREDQSCISATPIRSLRPHTLAAY
jgi:hypothetical protein